MKELRYFAWNAIVIGTLVAGYLLNCMVGTGIAIGILYGFIIPFNAVLVLFSQTKTVKEELVKSKISMKWTVIFEPVFISLVIYMGYKKLGVAMIAETLMYFYLCIVIKEARKETK